MHIGRLYRYGETFYDLPIKTSSLISFSLFRVKINRTRRVMLRKDPFWMSSIRLLVRLTDNSLGWVRNANGVIVSVKKDLHIWIKSIKNLETVYEIIFCNNFFSLCSVNLSFQKSVDIYQTIIAIKAQHIKCAKPNFNAIILKELSYAPVNLTCRIAVMVYFMVFAYKPYHFRRQIRGKCKSRNSMYTSKVYLNYRFEFDIISR